MICLIDLSRDMTKPTKWVCAQWRLRSDWASAQTDQSSLSAWRNLGPLATHWAHSAQRRLWPDTHFVGFVMLRLIYRFMLLLVCRPENVHRLFDLVNVQNPDILPAFYFALRDTLVANDLEQATRIAYGKTRYRVVTLQGQLIDTSGEWMFWEFS